MILKALYDYYQRCDNLVRKGLELKEIGYLIVLEKDGTFVRIESRMQDSKTASSFCVLQTVKRSGTKYIPNYFWDKYEYIVGGDNESEKKHKTFKSLVNRYKELLPDNDYVNAIFSFYQKYNNIENILKEDRLYDDLNKSIKSISFLINGYTSIAAEDKEIINRVLLTENAKAYENICLISGIKSSISRLHTSIKLTKDSGPLVAFQKSSGYDSYGKTQANNAPISEDAEFAYTTALNHLLRADSRNKFSIGNRTFVFWASKDDEAGKQVEESIWNLLGFKDSNEDDSDRNIEQVRKVFNSIYSGALKTSLNDKFYILGLAPNSARIAITYWAEIPLREFAERINRHFKDMDIDGSKECKPYMGLHSMLYEVTLNGKVYGKDSKLIPNLPESVVKSIFQGIPYPEPLFSSCIRRIRAEMSNKDKKAVSITRAAIIKAYLNRLNNKEQDIKVMLDKENTNQGYLCGRLFAVLDKIQSEANGQHSIKERYMNAASATPATVFSTILNLSSHHSEKLNEARNVFYEKVKQEIIDKINSDGFPAHLDLQDQGRFFVGYYHQMQSFFIKNEESK